MAIYFSLADWNNRNEIGISLATDSSVPALWAGTEDIKTKKPTIIAGFFILYLTLKQISVFCVISFYR